MFLSIPASVAVDVFIPFFCRHVRKLGGICVADEVQTGFGRSGKHGFWAFERQGMRFTNFDYKIGHKSTDCGIFLLVLFYFIPYTINLEL